MKTQKELKASQLWIYFATAIEGRCTCDPADENDQTNDVFSRADQWQVTYPPIPSINVSGDVVLLLDVLTRVNQELPGILIKIEDRSLLERIVTLSSSIPTQGSPFRYFEQLATCARLAYNPDPHNESLKSFSCSASKPQKEDRFCLVVSWKEYNEVIPVWKILRLGFLLYVLDVLEAQRRRDTEEKIRRPSREGQEQHGSNGIAQQPVNLEVESASQQAVDEVLAADKTGDDFFGVPKRQTVGTVDAQAELERLARMHTTAKPRKVSAATGTLVSLMFVIAVAFVFWPRKNLDEVILAENTDATKVLLQKRKTETSVRKSQVDITEEGEDPVYHEAPSATGQPWPNAALKNQAVQKTVESQAPAASKPSASQIAQVLTVKKTINAVKHGNVSWQEQFAEWKQQVWSLVDGLVKKSETKVSTSVRLAQGSHACQRQAVDGKRYSFSCKTSFPLLFSDKVPVIHSDGTVDCYEEGRELSQGETVCTASK